MAHDTRLTDPATAPATPPGPAPAGGGVRLRGLRRAFDGRTVLDGVDLDVAKGEFTALLGHSGSGKSTLLRAAGRLDGGGEGLVEVPEPSAVVFQDARLLPWSRVLENVVLGLPGPRSAALARGRAALAEVGLAGRERAWPGTLSGGEAQRAALARALVREPELLLLDEPFGALDALTRIRMHALLRDLCARHRPAVLLVTHDVDEALLLADRVLVLADGRFCLDLPLPGPAGPDRRRDPAFPAQRERLLRALGVPESEPGADLP
ncbi:ABC transporter ATP-binding protein [Kitasatospora sp. NPDC090308]|uniref:ABC transporter ATP-binding protein n=1 Tax=Kitasatospora sp. NPDC090308 TaxID=3364082 RepID=UPI0038000487